jgi:hypothetical protein
LDEIASLKRQLAEQEQARLAALLAVADLERQLDEAQQADVPAPEAPDEATARKLAEFEELKGHFRRFQKETAAEQQSKRAEVAGVRAQLFAAQKLLQTERRTRKSETLRVNAQVVQLRNDLAAARSLVVSVRKEHAVHRKNWLIAGMGVSIAVLAVVITSLLWRLPAATASQAATHDAVVPDTPRELSAPVPQRGASADTGMPVGPQQAFSRDIGRLNHALDAFPGRSPEEILREVHRKNLLRGTSVCSFEWNGGQPAMMLSGNGSGGSPLTSSIAGCAEAVENYR